MKTEFAVVSSESRTILGTSKGSINIYGRSDQTPSERYLPCYDFFLDGISEKADAFFELQ